MIAVLILAFVIVFILALMTIGATIMHFEARNEFEKYKFKIERFGVLIDSDGSITLSPDCIEKVVAAYAEAETIIANEELHLKRN